MEIIVEGSTVYHGDCLEVMDKMEKCSVDSIVTDPPYHLTSIVKRFGKEDAAPAKHGTDGVFVRSSKGFMGKEWDGGDIAFQVETWRKCYELLKPGGHMIAFSGSRTYHRMAVAIEDAGFMVVVSPKAITLVMVGVQLLNQHMNQWCLQGSLCRRSR